MSVSLASPVDVLSRIGSQRGTEQELAMQSALDAARVLIEEIIDTSLSFRTDQDSFDYAARSYSNEASLQTLRLTYGFLTGNVFVFMSADGSAIADDVDEADAIDSTLYSVDRQKGIVTLKAAPYPCPRSVAVRYEHGFDDTATVPDFLKEAAIAGAVAVNQNHSIGFRNNKFRDNAPQARRLLQQLLQNKVRPRHGQWPSDSIEVVAV